MKGWTEGLHMVGNRVTWNGMVLVCTREHFAGHAAVHPWDPGCGWDVEKRATLWRPESSVVGDLVERAERAEKRVQNLERAVSRADLRVERGEVRQGAWSE